MSKEICAKLLTVPEDLAVLKHTAMPAVLVEMAFIDNEEDCEKLINQQEEFAAAIARGVTDYLSQ